MQTMKRYAIYYAPQPGAFARAAAEWLGWDPEAGRAVEHADLFPALAKFTAEPRKYGFHATLKPPFRLAPGESLESLKGATAALAANLHMVELPGLELTLLDGFLAFVPSGDTAPLNSLADQVVAAFEPFRADLSEAEIARRHPHQLTPRQRELLAQFGYPYVMEEFRFHLTLTGQLTETEAARLRPMALAHFHACLPERFAVAELCLFGEAEDGVFHLLHRYPLAV
jgi:putative phosphonate metabolism protein